MHIKINGVRVSWYMCHFAYLYHYEDCWKPEHWKLIKRGAALHWWLIRLPVVLALIAGVAWVAL